jgi:hypothetical protein
MVGAFGLVGNGLENKLYTTALYIIYLRWLHGLCARQLINVREVNLQDVIYSKIGKAIARAPVSSRTRGAKLLLLADEPGVEPVVPVPPTVVVVDELGDEVSDGLGHKLLYTYCSGAPLQVPTAPPLYVPFEYIQHVPDAYGELLGLCGLKTT